MQKDHEEEEDYLPDRYFSHKPSKIVPKTIANIHTQGTKKVVESSRIGWWLTHKFSKRSTMDITHFCGWKELERLIGQCNDDMEEALIATLFLTGGRASEVLSLRHEQFEERKDFILIKGMLVLKQKKPENRYRQVLIRKNNFLIPYMMQWVNRKKKGQLFDFKYNKLYKMVVGIDKDWFPHKFRGMRASQLATETGINTVILLMKWFGWTSEKMPAHYARMSTKEIEEAYRRHEERAILGR